MKAKARFLLQEIWLFFTDDTWFRLLFLISYYFSTICLFGAYVHQSADFFMIWGLGLLAYHFLFKREFHKIRYRYWLLLFLGSALVTTLLRFQDNLLVNFYYYEYIIICLFLYYGIHATKSRSAVHREMTFILSFITAATTVLMGAGLILLMAFPNGLMVWNEPLIVQRNRFTGLIFNANITAFYAAMAIVAITILWVIRRSVNRLSRKRIAVYLFCLAVNFIALFLTDSNDSLLMVVVYCWFLALYLFFKDCRHFTPGIWMRVVAFLLLSVIAAFAALGARILVQTGVSDMLHPPEVLAAEEEEVLFSTHTTFRHENSNLDSGRAIVWGQAYDLICRFPMFGIGRANFEDYGNRYLDGLRYDDFHNGLISLAVSYGLMGTLLFLVFAFLAAGTTLKTIFCRIKKESPDARLVIYLASFVGAYSLYSMFEIALLMDLSYKVLVFWLLLGYLSAYWLPSGRPCGTLDSPSHRLKR